MRMGDIVSLIWAPQSEFIKNCLTLLSWGNFDQTTENCFFCLKVTQTNFPRRGENWSG